MVLLKHRRGRGSSCLGKSRSLQVVNQLAPEDRRAKVVSSYFLCGFSGNALPVVRIGVLSTLANSTVASMTFAALIIFALAAFFFGVIYIRADDGTP
jgi:hypothetical protein